MDGGSTRLQAMPRSPSRSNEFRDRACSDVHLERECIGSGFRNYDRFTVTLHGAGGASASFERDLLRSGPVVGVLPVDVVRDEVVLVRQFRLGGHLGANLGEMIEIVAGGLDNAENHEDAARRECAEEIGVVPHRLIPLLEFAPAPALTDEYMRLFLAAVDAGILPRWAGVSHEHEQTEVLRYTISEATRLIPACHSGPTLIALQWLAANRAGLGDYLG
jgi:ADP-ribose pyrophosphatase